MIRAEKRFLRICPIITIQSFIIRRKKNQEKASNWMKISMAVYQQGWIYRNTIVFIVMQNNVIISFYLKFKGLIQKSSMTRSIN